MRNLVVLSSEWVFVATILVLGAVTGIVATRQAALDSAREPAAALMQSQVNGQESSAR